MTVNLSIKDVPDELAERLRQRAARHHHSLQGELMAIVEQAALAAPAPAPLADSPMAGKSWTQGWKTAEQLMSERRARPRHTTAGLPLAMDIIRADRDSR